MNLKLRNYVDEIVSSTIADIQVDKLVRKALANCQFPKQVKVIAIGKAAWQMAKSVSDVLGDTISSGIVITKYEHCKGDIPNFECYEAGHPILDENSIKATNKVIELVSKSNEKEYVLFLVSGGGSALFESPLVSLDELQSINNQLLRCGASIDEINTIRKRLSAVKGGKFAQLCYPAQVHSIILSDVLGDKLDVIASGPSCVDVSTCIEAVEIVERYNLNISQKAKDCLNIETPKELANISHEIIGSVKELCQVCATHCERLGFETIILTDCYDGEARELGRFLGASAKSNCHSNKKLAFVAGGESIVHLTGNGLGGRNQELALGAALSIASLPNVCVFSLGSDGTDGPTEAAGGYVDGDTASELASYDISISDVLSNNDAYHALKKVNGLLITGPTGTNVNDVSVVLIDAE